MKGLLIVIAVAALAGCSSNRVPDVEGGIRSSLKQAGLNDVSVSQDRNKGVVTLGGNVKVEADKDRAEQIAKSLAVGQVVANQVAVLPTGYESTAKSVNSDLDKGIEANLDAAFTQANIKGVNHSTKNGVVTLKGDLESLERRAEAQRLAGAVPHVQQVVNQIDVKNQRATSSGG